MSSPLITRPNTTSLSFKSGIGAVVINKSNPLLLGFFAVPIINASCFGLQNRRNTVNIKDIAIIKDLVYKTKIQDNLIYHYSGIKPEIIFPTSFSFSYPFLGSSIKIKITSLNYKIFYDMPKWHSFEMITLAVQ